MSVRTRVAEGKSNRVKALADELGVRPNTIYKRALRGELESLRLGRVVMIPARAAAPLLGMPVPAEVTSPEAA